MQQFVLYTPILILIEHFFQITEESRKQVRSLLYIRKSPLPTPKKKCLILTDCGENTIFALPGEPQSGPKRPSRIPHETHNRHNQTNPSETMGQEPVCVPAADIRRQSDVGIRSSRLRRGVSVLLSGVIGHIRPQRRGRPRD